MTNRTNFSCACFKRHSRNDDDVDDVIFAFSTPTFCPFFDKRRTKGEEGWGYNKTSFLGINGFERASNGVADIVDQSDGSVRRPRAKFRPIAFRRKMGFGSRRKLT